jgi:high-affinity iron transporter
MTRFSRALEVGFGCLTIALFSTAVQAAEADVRRVWQLLDYLSVDYAGAVKNGAVIKESEFAEMNEFAQAAQTKLAALEARPEQPALLSEAASLEQAIQSKDDPSRVSALAKALANHLLATYPIPSSPTVAPNVAAGAVIYQAQCAACHGATGHGDGPVGLRLDPRPVAFAETGRAAQRSAFGLYQVITQGIEGTPMVSFASLPESDRWALAYYIGHFAHGDADVESGAKLWKGDPAVRSQLTSLDALSRTTQADLANQIGAERAALTMAYLHAHPEAVVNTRPANFDIARQKLASSVKAYAESDIPHATELALAAYLDGVEPIEPTLAARDSGLMGRIETGMSKFRSLVTAKAALNDVRASAAENGAMFTEAESVLGSGTDATAAYVGSLTILVREGLEALLVVVAMIAFLRKAERVDMLRYVHAGWIGALGLGAVTWAIATFLVKVSGANREVTEGLSSLFAAVVLLSVGMWMHQKSMAGMWQQYIHAKLSAALSRKSAWFMFALSFIAVYREVFETILFYVALWEQGNHRAVLGGLATGAAVLVLIALALLRFSARLPIGKFFSWSAGLVAVLAVVLTGKGMAALQEAGWLGAHALNTPRIDLLGIYPSTQTLIAQILMILLVVAGFAWNGRQSKQQR